MNWLRLITGCAHSSVTFPQTRKRVTYVACLSCGREFSYDFKTMRMGPELAALANSSTVEALRTNKVSGLGEVSEFMGAK